MTRLLLIGLLWTALGSSAVQAQEGAAGEQGADDEATPEEGGATDIEEAPAPNEEARAHFVRGQTAYNGGEYETAIREWTQAFALDPRPRIQFNLSQAYERLGRLSEAAAALDRYLETASPDDEYQPSAAARRGAIRERLSRTGIVVRGAPDGAAIVVDGEDWGRTPRPDAISVEPGSHAVVLRLEGHRDSTSQVVVPAGQTVEVGGALEELPPPPEGGGSVWPWILIGSGGAFLIVTALVGVSAIAQANDAPYAEGPEADSARATALAADVLGLFSLGIIGSGFLWLLLDDGDPEEAHAADLRLTPYAGPDGAGAAARVGF